MKEPACSIRRTKSCSSGKTRTLFPVCHAKPMRRISNIFRWRYSMMAAQRTVFLTNDTNHTLSAARYIDYDHSTQILKTPWYYAQFGRNRFHFVKAGIAIDYLPLEPRPMAVGQDSNIGRQAPVWFSRALPVQARPRVLPVVVDSAYRYLDLTNELRIEIKLKALWGLVPIGYNEESLVCFVKRYKTGVRLSDAVIFISISGWVSTQAGPR